MPTHTPDGYLTFQATDNGSTLTPVTQFTAVGPNPAAVVNDVDGDARADAGDDFAGATYSGYTLTINSNEYAVFGSVGSGYFIPFFDSTENLFGLHNTPVPFGFTDTPNNAAVVNLCFLEGTMIAVPDGERRVEELVIGDIVRTAEGRDVAVKWVGRQVMSSLVNAAMHEKCAPVCISAKTLGNHSDLYVSADHGMIIDDLVINASALVNGTTVRFVPLSDMPEQFTYYHIETEAHEVILANGAAAETFMDAAGRETFDNHQEYLDLYGTERIIPEMGRLRISAQRLLPEGVKTKLGIEDEMSVMLRVVA